MKPVSRYFLTEVGAPSASVGVDYALVTVELRAKLSYSNGSQQWPG